jgi:hypothetical protein
MTYYNDRTAEKGHAVMKFDILGCNHPPSYPRQGSFWTGAPERFLSSAGQAMNGRAVVMCIPAMVGQPGSNWALVFDHKSGFWR